MFYHIAQETLGFSLYSFFSSHDLIALKQHFWDFLGCSAVKNLSARAGDTGDVSSILGREEPLE